MRPALAPSVLTALIVVVAVAVPGRAGTPPSATLTQPGQRVTWTGQLTTPDPMGCGEVVSKGCDVTPVTVVAAKGAWITVGVDAKSAPNSYVRVTDGATYVAGKGQHIGQISEGAGDPTTTFRQVRDGKVVYTVGVSSMSPTPMSPIVYHAWATLSGKQFDREGACFVGGLGVDHVQDADEGQKLHLSVRLVTAPSDAAEVQGKVVPALIETYARINIALKVSVQAFPLKETVVGEYPFDQVRRSYGGVRPPGVDVVHVLTDNFAGGFADCIGGVAYPEKAFSTGSLHYAAQGLVPVPTVKAAAIAAHEIGHLLGGQHQQGNCVEAAPQQAQQPASDGSVGPCTVMSPGAAQISETFSTLERSSIRYYVRTYAKG